MLFETLAPVDASSIDANLHRRFADRLCKVDVSAELAKQWGMKVNYVYIFVLIDHQSTDEPHTLVQMLGYLVRIWEDASANQQPLVSILPWVVYNGGGPWRSSRVLAELFPVPDTWKRYMPSMEPAILDVSRMEDSKMAGVVARPRQCLAPSEASGTKQSVPRVMAKTLLFELL